MAEELPFLQPGGKQPMPPKPTVQGCTTSPCGLPGEGKLEARGSLGQGLLLGSLLLHRSSSAELELSKAGQALVSQSATSKGIGHRGLCSFSLGDILSQVQDWPDISPLHSFMRAEQWPLLPCGSLHG